MKCSKHCDRCGCAFLVWPSKRDRSRYCSLACKRGTLRENFFEKVLKTDSCWLWTGGRANGQGYGSIVHGRKHLAAHRLSYEMHIGPIPPGLKVLHRCDNPSCVRPDHLMVGTQGDNVTDMVAKDRQGSKLRANQIPAIRARLAAGDSHSTIARDYGVSPALIGHIGTGRAWSHVP